MLTAIRLYLRDAIEELRRKAGLEAKPAAAAAMDPEYKLAKQTLDDMTAGRAPRPEPVMQAGYEQK